MILSELASSGEIEKFHTVVENTSGVQTKKRITKSKTAIGGGGVDTWFWRLKGPQADESGPKLEEEPVVTEAGWHQPNQLYPSLKDIMEKKMERDPYGAGRLDHLNRRRRKARPEKVRQEKE
jgi:hypothetical protein